MIRYTRNGKMHFLRIGRLCFSFVLAAGEPKPKTDKRLARRIAVHKAYDKGYSDGRYIGWHRGHRDAIDNLRNGEVH